VRLAAPRLIRRTVRSIDRGEQRVLAMRPFINLANTLGANTEGLVRLMATGATTPIRPEALKESVVLINIAARIERRHRASLVLEMFEIRNEMDYGGCCA